MMKPSERLRRKIKQQCPQIDYIDNVVFHRAHGRVIDGGCSWFAQDPTNLRNPEIFGYETMTECARNPIEIEYCEGQMRSMDGWYVTTIMKER
nr:MAG TPA: hypothetical protein [Caudoviricetes sp.]